MIFTVYFPYTWSKSIIFDSTIYIKNKGGGAKNISDIYVGIHYIHYLLGSPVFRLEDGEACCSYALQTVM